MQYFQSIDKIVDFSHKALHENNFRQTYTQVFQFRRKCLELAEIV